MSEHFNVIMYKFYICAVVGIIIDQLIYFCMTINNAFVYVDSNSCTLVTIQN